MRSGAAPVAIVDRLPIYRQGLLAALECADMEAVELASLRDLPPGAQFAAVIVVLRSSVDWQRMAAFHVERTEQVLVAVLPSLATPIVERALCTGACGVIDASAIPADVVQVIRAALEGKTLLPSEVAHEVLRETAEGHTLSATKIEWLQGLARGLTVGELAKSAGYSEREMHRHLARLYEQLGVQRLKEALLWAERAGFLT